MGGGPSHKSLYYYWSTGFCYWFQFVGFECLMTSLVDLFPTYLRQGYRREVVLLVLCSGCCVLGLPLVTEVCTVYSTAVTSLCVLCHVIYIADNILSKQKSKHRHKNK